MAGDEFMGDVPFHNVYLTGIVRDKLGRKMSKTLGNSPDPLDLIAKYGADAVRIGMLLCSSAGNDIFYDEAQVEQGRNFCNKIWNSFRLIRGWKVGDALQSEAAKVAVKWFSNKLSQTVEVVEEHYSKFRISDALMTIYRLYWDDFCSWYLEAVKPAYGEFIDSETYKATVDFMENLLKMIHPVMPFITEELWQALKERGEGGTIMFERTPEAGSYDCSVIDGFEITKEIVNGVRAVRSEKGISPKETLKLRVKGDFDPEFAPAISKLANVSDITKAGDQQGAVVSFVVRTLELSVPLEGHVDTAAEIAKAEEALAYQRKFLAGVRKKLSNEAFIAHAPEKVVAMERRKEADSLSRIEILESQLKELKNKL